MIVGTVTSILLKRNETKIGMLPRFGSLPGVGLIQGHIACYCRWTAMEFTCTGCVIVLLPAQSNHNEQENIKHDRVIISVSWFKYRNGNKRSCMGDFFSPLQRKKWPLWLKRAVWFRTTVIVCGFQIIDNTLIDLLLFCAALSDLSWHIILTQRDTVTDWNKKRVPIN